MPSTSSTPPHRSTAAAQVVRGEGAGRETATAPAAGPFDELDRAYARLLDDNPTPPGGSLLAQTILTGAARRSLLPLLDVPAGADVLDLGTGYGPVLLELARVRAVRGLGVDTDVEVLAAAEAITSSLASWLHEGSSLRFLPGEARALEVEDGAFDLVCARLLFQHLEDPRAVVRECRRVLRPGGRAVVFDVDDGFSVTYPPASPELGRLEAAFDRAQSMRGGDREVGRKLTTYFADAGFAIGSVQLLAQAQHVAPVQGDASRLVNLARLRAARAEILRAGLLGAEEFDRCLAAYEVEPAVARFRAESQIVLVAVRT